MIPKLFFVTGIYRRVCGSGKKKCWMNSLICLHLDNQSSRPTRFEFSKIGPSGGNKMELLNILLVIDYKTVIIVMAAPKSNTINK